MLKKDVPVNLKVRGVMLKLQEALKVNYRQNCLVCITARMLAIIIMYPICFWEWINCI